MKLNIGDTYIEVVPVNEFKFPEPGPDHFKLTCRNHPTAQYSTKNPYSRNLHFLRAAEGFGYSECPCPFGDLVVIVKQDQGPCGA